VDWLVWHRVGGWCGMAGVTRPAPLAVLVWRLVRCRYALREARSAMRDARCTLREARCAMHVGMHGGGWCGMAGVAQLAPLVVLVWRLVRCVVRLGRAGARSAMCYVRCAKRAVQCAKRVGMV
jgi:hypothetical protein